MNSHTYAIVISDADGGRTFRSRRSEFKSATHDEERQKLENELKLQREQVHDFTAQNEALVRQLTEIVKYQGRYEYVLSKF